jgi:hypothetical protein
MEQHRYNSDQHRCDSKSEIKYHVSGRMQNGGETGRSPRDFRTATL